MDHSCEFHLIVQLKLLFALDINCKIAPTKDCRIGQRNPLSNTNKKIECSDSKNSNKIT